MENAGLILTGFGVALAGASLHQPALLAVGLLAATLQTWRTRWPKARCSGQRRRSRPRTGTDASTTCAGSARRLPFSGTGFAVGALALAGLPPTVGFASEWFLLEALMQQFRLSGLAVKLAMALAGALVALTVGFATVAFVRVLGLTDPGRGPAPQPAAAAAARHRRGRPGRPGRARRRLPRGRGHHPAGDPLSRRRARPGRARARDARRAGQSRGCCSRSTRSSRCCPRRGCG